MVSLTSLANRSTNGEPSERAGRPRSPTDVHGAPSEAPWLPTNHPNSVTAQGTLLHTRDKPYTTGLTTCSVQRVIVGYSLGPGEEGAQDGRYGKNSLNIVDSGARYKVYEPTHTDTRLDRLTGHRH